MLFSERLFPVHLSCRVDNQCAFHHQFGIDTGKSQFEQQTDSFLHICETLLRKKGLTFDRTRSNDHFSRNTPSSLYSESFSAGNWSHARESICVTSKNWVQLLNDEMDKLFNNLKVQSRQQNPNANHDRTGWSHNVEWSMS